MSPCATSAASAPAGRQRVAALVVVDIALQLVIIALGAALVVDIDALTNSIELGTSPEWDDLIFALTVSTVAFTSLEAASGLAGEVAVGRRGLKRLVASATASVLVIYVGISLVAVAALPVTRARARCRATPSTRPCSRSSTSSSRSGWPKGCCTRWPPSRW